MEKERRLLPLRLEDDVFEDVDPSSIVAIEERGIGPDRRPRAEVWLAGGRKVVVRHERRELLERIQALRRSTFVTLGRIGRPVIELDALAVESVEPHGNQSRAILRDGTVIDIAAPAALLEQWLEEARQRR